MGTVIDEDSDDDCVIIGEFEKPSVQLQPIPKRVKTEESESPAVEIENRTTETRGGRKKIIFKKEDVLLAVATVAEPRLHLVNHESRKHETARSVFAKSEHFLTTTFDFHVERQQFVYALQVVSLTVRKTFFPKAEIFHSVIFKIFLVSDCANVERLCISLLLSLLESNPPINEKTSDFYWSIMSRKCNDEEWTSRWLFIYDLLESVSGRSDETSEVAADREEIVLDFISSVLESDFRKRNAGSRCLTTRVFWPESGESVGHFNFRCSELARFHIAALEKGNLNLFQITGRLLNILMEIVNECDNNTGKIRQPQEKLVDFCCSLFALVYQENLNFDFNFFIQNFENPSVRLILSSLFLEKLANFELLTTFSAKKIFQVYLKWRPHSSSYIEEFYNLNSNVKKVFLVLFDAYLELFHLRKIFAFFRKLSAGKKLEKRGTENVLSKSYTSNDLMSDLCFLKYISEQTTQKCSSLTLLLLF